MMVKNKIKMLLLGASEYCKDRLTNHIQQLVNGVEPSFILPNASLDKSSTSISTCTGNTKRQGSLEDNTRVVGAEEQATEQIKVAEEGEEVTTVPRRHRRIANLVDGVTALINNVSIHGFAAHVDITSTCRNVASINDFAAHVDNTNACRDVESTNGFAVHVNDTLHLQFGSPSPPRAHNSAPSFVRERDSSMFDSFSPKEATHSMLNYTLSISFPFEHSKTTIEIPTTMF
ncbi:hypothetical protein K443DRAFT_624618 [Laccaria amethystina LaAM-08-1]|uniref:Uncharacterized protein n=1 Tax=Laccaria amethystina LaAM-08-1 TaxID=1095629 RepID=A0A0C9XNS0_9AGAR|nr:hypothetical protein K443DRAFT_624618 [Laccaria amethystina LaAM-08-1]